MLYNDGRSPKYPFAIKGQSIPKSKRMLTTTQRPPSPPVKRPPSPPVQTASEAVHKGEEDSESSPSIRRPQATIDLKPFNGGSYNSYPANFYSNSLDQGSNAEDDLWKVSNDFIPVTTTKRPYSYRQPPTQKSRPQQPLRPPPTRPPTSRPWNRPTTWVPPPQRPTRRPGTSAPASSSSPFKFPSFPNFPTTDIFKLPWGSGGSSNSGSSNTKLSSGKPRPKPNLADYKNSDTDDFDYDVDFYVDNNYEYIDTEEVNTLQDLFERNRLLNDKHSEDIDKIDFDFEQVDYGNYDYIEPGVLDFSKPPRSKIRVNVPARGGFSKRRIRRPGPPLRRPYRRPRPRQSQIGRTLYPQNNIRNINQRNKLSYVPTYQIRQRVGQSDFLDARSN